MNLPYGFYNDNFGAAVGWVYGATGWPQKQSTFVATAMGGTNSAVAGSSESVGVNMMFAQPFQF